MLVIIVRLIHHLNSEHFTKTEHNRTKGNRELIPNNNIVGNIWFGTHILNGSNQYNKDGDNSGKHTEGTQETNFLHGSEENKGNTDNSSTNDDPDMES